MFGEVDAVVEGTVTDVNHGYLRLAWCGAKALADHVFHSDHFHRSDYEAECGVRVTLAVTRVWKGSVGDSLVLTTGRGGGDCGMPFEGDRSYLLYLGQLQPGVFTTNICMRPQPIEDAATDRDVLARLTGKRVEL
jgi:hypothetical protein